MKLWSFTKRQIWVIIIVLVFVAMLLDLNTRISTLTYLNEQKSTLQADVEMLQSTADVIADRITYAESDTAVEEWARQQGMMMQEGDHVIIPLPGATMVPTPTVVPTPFEDSLENWEVWRALIFD